MSSSPENQQPPKAGGRSPQNLYWIYAAIALFILLSFFFFQPAPRMEKISWRQFQDTLITRGLVERVTFILASEQKREVQVYLKKEAFQLDEFKKKFEGKSSPEKGPQFYFDISSSDDYERYLNEKGIPVEIEEPRDYSFLTTFLLPIGILALIFFLVMRRMGGGGPGGQIFNIGKSKALLYDKENKVSVTFNDVAGLEEAKEEVMEVVEFLKNPSKFTRLGGHIPKGVLLVGPPGTGKTLLAKAVAGEAKVPFFSLSGSDFVEMFVGVGAARVRDLFKQAKEKAPCIVFIDEIDAVGRSRGKSNFTGGNDERENTLNQLLVEMDGFNSDTGVILMAATNRPDVLDPALLRPGRFDRQIGIDRPDIKGREQIFQVHLKSIKMDGNVNAATLASQTPGFVGADIMNVCNEAALIAARKNKEAVEMSDFQDAIDRVIGGLEKKNKIISPEEKKIISYHEAGHAVAGWFLEYAYPLVKVTIVPRGISALGYAQYLPKEQYLYTKDQLLDQMGMTLGGRAAEKIIFGHVSTGAQNDLERVTSMAYAMVSIYGMNDKIGSLSYNVPDSEYSFNRPYSEETAFVIDQEVSKLVKESLERTIVLLESKKAELEIIAQELLEKEVLFKDDLERLIGPRPFGYPQEKSPEELKENNTVSPTENPVISNADGTSNQG